MAITMSFFSQKNHQQKQLGHPIPERLRDVQRNKQIKVVESDLNPANTKHEYNICTTSAHRLRRLSNNVQMLYNCFVFTGK